jgi:hypothetical protein
VPLNIFNFKKKEGKKESVVLCYGKYIGNLGNKLGT